PLRSCVASSARCAAEWKLTTSSTPTRRRPIWSPCTSASSCGPRSWTRSRPTETIMAKYQVAKHGLGGWRLWFVGLWFAACGETATVESGSETHFLLRCIESCGAGFECLGGVCTRDCETDTDCSDLSAAA